MKKSESNENKKSKDGKSGGVMHRKHIYGTVVVGERGQIVIPKEARMQFDMSPGDKLFVMGRAGRGIILVKTDRLKRFAENILKNL